MNNHKCKMQVLAIGKSELKMNYVLNHRHLLKLYFLISYGELTSYSLNQIFFPMNMPPLIFLRVYTVSVAYFHI